MSEARWKLEIDDIVSRAVRKRPGESIIAACRRIMAAPHGDPAWRVASVILSGRPADPWRCMARAAKVARRLASQSRSDAG